MRKSKRDLIINNIERSILKELYAKSKAIEQAIYEFSKSNKGLSVDDIIGYIYVKVYSIMVKTLDNELKSIRDIRL